MGVVQTTEQASNSSALKTESSQDQMEHRHDERKTKFALPREAKQESQGIAGLQVGNTRNTQIKDGSRTLVTAGLPQVDFQTPVRVHEISSRNEPQNSVFRLPNQGQEAEVSSKWAMLTGQLSES
jgi:hypothetical protein